MKGDFSNDRFDPTKHFSRVLKQQGRVDLDSDWNEQAAIWQHQMRTLIRDLFGQNAGPQNDCGFGIVDWNALSADDTQALQSGGFGAALGDFIFRPGHYYVGGLLVENEGFVSYGAQPDLTVPKLESGHTYLVYLDVWERHITVIEDDGIREPALGGPDTTTRAKVTWQVKVRDLATMNPANAGGAKAIAKAPAPPAVEKGPAASDKKKSVRRLQRAEVRAPRLAAAGDGSDDCGASIATLLGQHAGQMSARTQPPADETPCVLPPDAPYRGQENQLYRVEIHRGSDNPDNDLPTFKWSRENGSVVTRWTGTDGQTLNVASSRGFETGDWIEIGDDTNELQGQPGQLKQVLAVSTGGLTVDAAPAWAATMRTPKIRRWEERANDDQALDDGAVPIDLGTTGQTDWIDLEAGIQVQFKAGDFFRTGDYWLIPARVATGIAWPKDPVTGKAAFAGPRGIEHNYAPLATLQVTATSPFVSIVKDCRCQIAPLPCISADQ